jgi:3-oxoadipate enol-lactonase
MPATLYCLELGEPAAPGLVLLHGLGMGHRMWQPQLEALSVSFHVLAPDLPGFARSAAAGPFTLELAAARTGDLVEQRLGGHAHVCGLSLGAMTAIVLAGTLPGSVEGLVLSGAQVRPNRLVGTLQAAAFSLMPGERLVKGLSSFVPPGHPDLTEMARDDLRATGKPGLLTAVRQAGRADLRPILGRISAPTLVVCGERDRFNLKASRDIAAAINGASLKIVTDVGHVWNLEAPTLFTDTVTEFFGDKPLAHG